MTNIPPNISIDRVYDRNADHEAIGLVATLRDTETVALIRVSHGEYRTVVFTEAEQVEAEALDYDWSADLDGPGRVATRHLAAGEVLVSVL